MYFFKLFGLDKIKFPSMSEVVPPELSLQIIFAPTIGISLLSINSKIFPFTF